MRAIEHIIIVATRVGVIPAGQEREVHALIQKVRTMQERKIRFNTATARKVRRKVRLERKTRWVRDPMKRSLRLCCEGVFIDMDPCVRKRDND
jgi:hypothetical protein